VVVGILVWLWPALQQLPVGDAPAAAFLNGPDAGEWALNAQLVGQGELQQVDPHRMPTFLFVLAATMGILGEVAPAGHLVAVASWALLPVVLYGLGCRVGGRLVGALSAALVVGCAPLVREAAQFGVDPLLSVLLPTAMLAAVASRCVKWPAALGAGAVAAVAACTHLMALPYVIPALLFALWRPAGCTAPARLPLRFGAFVMGLVGVVLALDLAVGLISLDAFVHSISEGIARGTGAPEDGGLSEAARQQLADGRSESALGATHVALQPYLGSGVGWGPGVVVFWVGVVGLGLREAVAWPDSPPAWLRPWLGTAPDRRWRGLGRGWLAAFVGWRHRLSPDGGTGLLLLACLAPLPLLVAADAPDRYAINLLPFVAVVLARGVGSVVAVLSWSAPVDRRRWIVAGIGLPVTVFVVWQSQSRLASGLASIPHPDTVPRLAWRLSVVVERALPGRSAVASPMREVPAHLGRPHCPRTSCVPSAEQTDAIAACLDHLRRSCAGEGPVPLVWLSEAPLGMGDDALSQAVGAHAAETWGELARVREGGFEGVVVAVPRE